MLPPPPPLDPPLHCHGRNINNNNRNNNNSRNRENKHVDVDNFSVFTPIKNEYRNAERLHISKANDFFLKVSVGRGYRDPPTMNP